MIYAMQAGARGASPFRQWLYGETISGIPYLSPHLHQTIGEAREDGIEPRTDEDRKQGW